MRTIECDSAMLPSKGCLQYFTGVGGDIVSLNGNHATAPHMITNLNYNICFRQEAGKDHSNTINISSVYLER